MENLANQSQILETDTKSGLQKIILVAVPILIIIGFIGLLKIIAFMADKPEEKRKPFTPLAVMADYAVLDNVELEVITQGEAVPRTEIDLVPQVGGKIVSISPNFIDGGIFKKGEVLLQIEDADYQVAVIRAEANVAQAQQVLTREIAEGEISLRDYEEMGLGQPTDLAIRVPQRQQAEAALLAAQAEVDSAKLNLGRTQITAPFNGRVRSKNSDVGQFVSPGLRLASIFSTDIVEVRLPLMDADLAKLNIPLAFSASSRKNAPPVEFSAVIGGEKQVWKGNIMRTDSVYDTQTRALYAIAEVLDPYGKGASSSGVPLAPGLFVTAKLPGKHFENVIVIPRDGLRPEDKVYIVDDKGQAEIRDTVVLDTNAHRAILKSGVAAGELVVLSPMEKSRVTMTLKALDINDPSKVLVDPPEPEWMIEKRKKQEAETGKKKRGKKKKTDDKILKDEEQATDAELASVKKAEKSALEKGDETTQSKAAKEKSSDNGAKATSGANE